MLRCVVCVSIREGSGRHRAAGWHGRQMHLTPPSFVEQSAHKSEGLGEFHTRMCSIASSTICVGVVVG